MSTPNAEPLFFGTTERPLFGWLHRPGSPEQAARVGVVLCNPFGFEAVCAHRAYRRFASAIAEAGAAAIRFDYDGTGDSAGEDRDPERVPAWVKSVHAAADALREKAGVEAVYLFGMRFGALIAAQAAGQRGDYAGLIAVAPVLSGKAYVRELKALQMALGLEGPPAGVQPEAGVQEAVGFRVTEATKSALSAIDIAKADRAPVSDVLVLDRDDLPPTTAWQQRLASQGAKVEGMVLPGYLGMVADPHKTEVATQMVAAVRDWVSARVQASGAPAHKSPSPIEASALFHVAKGEASVPVVEEAVFVDPQKSLFGILTAPANGSRSGRAILLLSAGAVHHIGPNRLHTTLARRWATEGHVVLRLDISGIGDSRPRPGTPENEVYTRHALEDIEIAAAYLRGEQRASEVVSVGLCSGAYNGIKAAAAGIRLEAVVAINPLTFFWNPTLSLDYPKARVASEAKRYGESARSLKAWKKLLRGDVHFRVLARIMAHRAADLARHQVREVARRLHIPLHEDLGAELEKIAKNRVSIHFVFADGDPGSVLLTEQGGSVVGKLARKKVLSIDSIEGPDHTFTPIWSHELLADALALRIIAPKSSQS